MRDKKSAAGAQPFAASWAQLLALQVAARHLGAEVILPAAEEERCGRHADLLSLAAEAGLRAREQHVSWRELLQLAAAVRKGSAAVMLLLGNGGALTLVGSAPGEGVVLLADPLAGDTALPTPIDELRLAHVWTGDIVLLRRRRGADPSDAPFGLGWLTREVLIERRLFRDIGIASLVLCALVLVPPLAWMAIVDRVVVHRSESTLLLLAAGVGIAVVYEMLLGHAQRLLVLSASCRIDTRLNMHILTRVLRLPIDYFEKHPAGEITFRLGEVWRIREFLTGRLFKTLLDCVLLLVLLPVLFLLHVTLAWIVIGCGVLAALVVLAYLPAIRHATSLVVAAETKKHATLVETIHGIRTVKCLALESRQLDEWDGHVAEAARARLAAGRVASWPQTLTTPIERFMYVGTLSIGAWLAISGDAQVTTGALMAFAMLSGRVAVPLIGMAQMVQEFELVRAAVEQASRVLNHSPERPPGAVGARPRLEGRLTFDDVTFSYPGANAPALEDLSFEVPAGGLLGLVGRSGSGKSTVTRLMQGISSGYSGLVKIDGIEIREIDLPHLRRNLGVVLQDNFLFRGSIRDNIAAERPGVTFERVVRAARLAGAEEFIERMPRGYDTWIEEGSPNLSGGQRQRLAIARALVTDPAILIFDEATSSLDPESEAIVNANLLRIARGRTVVVVSHRLSSLVDCDKILVLDRGRLLDNGRHPELLERCAIYRQLWLQQNRQAQAQRGPRSDVLPAVVSVNSPITV